MKSGHRIFANLYRDSVALMRMSAELALQEGVIQAFLVMATPANIALLEEAGLIEHEEDARPNDLLAAVQVEEGWALEDVFDTIDALLAPQPVGADGPGGSTVVPPRSIEAALERDPHANLALISCPGEFAAAEADKALSLGLNVMMFSDNVDLGDEARLKARAREAGLLMMGPDCGTAIIGGVPLGFANQVRRGDIGVIGASGTGLQQVTCLIDLLGCGISQAVGTGGRDLKPEIGGITMISALQALSQDDETKVIALVSKPPAAEVAAAVLDHAEKCGKPVVVNFLGAAPGDVARSGIVVAQTLEDAAVQAVALSTGDSELALPGDGGHAGDPEMAALARGLGLDQKYLRGLFSGGTFCYEALLLLAETIGPVNSNIPLNRAQALDDIWHSTGDSVIDLGEDAFTRGRPHPMIDHKLRNDRIVQEACDPGCGVILLDVVLGHGAHFDPAGIMIPAIREARASAEKDGRQVVFVGCVCGTENDPQNRARQEATLREAGVILAPSNARAVSLAGDIIARHRTSPGDGKAAGVPA